MARNSKKKQYLALGLTLATKKSKDPIGKRITKYSQEYVQCQNENKFKRKLHTLQLNYGKLPVEKRMKELLGIK